MSNWSLFLKLFYIKSIVTKQNLSDQAERHAASCGGTFPNSNGKEKRKGEGKKKINEKITTEWLRLSVKADALVTEPMRMQETGCGWCLLPGQQSPSPYLLAKTLVATAHSSPMAEITVTCRECTQHVRVNHLKLYTCGSHASHFLRAVTFCFNSGLKPVCCQEGKLKMSQS